MMDRIEKRGIRHLRDLIGFSRKCTSNSRTIVGEGVVGVPLSEDIRR
jgi:hypothetical protein